MRTIDTGFDFARIRAELDSSDWEDDHDNPGTQTRRVWLGTTFGITPSGKVYAPFACSNLDPCNHCKGSGTVAPRTGKRARKRAQRRTNAFGRGTMARGSMFASAGRAYAARVQKMRDRAHNASSTTCPVCGGVGSLEAFKDELFNETLEKEAEAIDAYVSWDDDSCFVCESRDAPEEDGEEDDAEDDAA